MDVFQIPNKEEGDLLYAEEIMALIAEARSYKIYTALLKVNTITNEPEVTVIKNTIGDIVWTRLDVGQYIGTLNGAFTADKTICPPFFSMGTVMGLYSSLPFDYCYNVNTDNTAPTDKIAVNVMKTSDGSFADLSEAIFDSPIFIEIRVRQTAG